MLRILLRFWPFALFAILFMICEVAVDMIQPRLMATIVDDGILGLSGDGSPDLALIRSTGLLMLLIVLAGGLSGVLSGAMANLCSQRFGNEIRKACFSRVMHLSFEQTDAFTTGSLITRITNDVTQLERLVQQSVRGFVRCLMFMVAGTITLLSLNQHFLVIIACAFPLVLLDIIFVLWKTNPLFLKLQQRIDAVNTVIRENISGARVVKAFVQEDREEERFGRANTALVKVQLRILILMSYLRPVMNIVLNLATVALIWVGALQVRQGGMQPGEVMAAVTYISQILNGMMMLAMIFQTLSRGTASYRRLKEVLDTRPVIQDPAGGVSAVSPDPASPLAISWQNVTFAYPRRSGDGGSPQAQAAYSAGPAASTEGKASPAGPKAGQEADGVSTEAALARSKASPGPDAVSGASIPLQETVRAIPAQDLEQSMTAGGLVLRGIDLQVAPGQTLAIVGSTGSGKTTLASLIPRFYDPTGGCVSVFGRDVRDHSLASLRDLVCFVPQKSQLFSTTIRDNIAMGCPQASEEAIRFAARCAQAEDFILAQPQGYDTPVAEGGMSLSGGQRQRIAIARALLKAAGGHLPAGGETGTGDPVPRILVLDDSTSALDLKTEAALYDALQTHFPALTCIVIAQRISTARRADRIAVLDKGLLAGCDTHQALLAGCPVYQDICASQQ